MYTVTPRGPFSLAETIGFTYIDRERSTDDRALLLAFCDDATWEPTAVTVTERGDAVRVDGPAATRAQVERVLGLDVDASSYPEVGRRDPVVATLQQVAPGLRPPQIPSAYEAAVFCILTARRSAAQARNLRRALAEHAGTVLEVDGRTVTCLPPPSVLLDPPALRGLDDVRRKRVSGVARAALEGRLDTSELARLDPEDARHRLEQLVGIGPFSSAIIAVRALGHPDHLAGPVTELNRLVGRLYDLGHDASPEELERIAEAWRPWRTWVEVGIRSAHDRMVDRT